MYERGFSNPYPITAADDLATQAARASTNDVIDLVVLEYSCFSIRMVKTAATTRWFDS